MEDKLADGYAVYIKAKGYRSGPMPDTGWTRLSANTKGKGDTRYAQGTLTANTVSGFEIRMCRADAGADTCTVYFRRAG